MKFAAENCCKKTNKKKKVLMKIHLSNGASQCFADFKRGWLAWITRWGMHRAHFNECDHEYEKTDAD